MEHLRNVVTVQTHYVAKKKKKEKTGSNQNDDFC